MTIPEVAQRLGKPEEGVRRMVQTRRLAATKIGGRLMVHEDVLAELERSALPGNAAAPPSATMDAGRPRR